MSGFVLEDLDLISNPVLYELAAFFGLEDRQARIDHKQALMDVYNWVIDEVGDPSKTEEMIAALRDKERSITTNNNEPRIATFRRELLMDVFGEKKEPQEVKEVKQESPKEEPKNYSEDFKEGMTQTNETGS